MDDIDQPVKHQIIIVFIIIVSVYVHSTCHFIYYFFLTQNLLERIWFNIGIV